MAGFALALLFAIGATSMSMAKTFVYVSNAQDGNIDTYNMDMSTGALTPVGKTEAAKMVMPMTLSPNKKYLYAVIRSQPTRVLTRQPARWRRKHRRRFPTACLMSRPITPDVSCSPLPMAGTSLR